MGGNSFPTIPRAVSLFSTKNCSTPTLPEPAIGSIIKSIGARDEAGAERIAKRIYRYDKERETLFLVHAEVIAEDGTAQALDERATFIQTPQHEAANSLYTSKAELSILFPNVQEGTLVRSMVLIREDEPIFPDEFATHFGFGGNWPTLSRTSSCRSASDRVCPHQSRAQPRRHSST